MTPAERQVLKLRAPELARDEIEQLLAEICVRTEAEPVQRVGKVLVIYRRNSGTEP